MRKVSLLQQNKVAQLESQDKIHNTMGAQSQSQKRNGNSIKRSQSQKAQITNSLKMAMMP